MIRSKIDRKRKTGQVPTLGGECQRPREGIKGWVNPFLGNWNGWDSWMEKESGNKNRL